VSQQNEENAVHPRSRTRSAKGLVRDHAQNYREGVTGGTPVKTGSSSINESPPAGGERVTRKIPVWSRRDMRGGADRASGSHIDAKVEYWGFAEIKWWARGQMLQPDEEHDDLPPRGPREDGNSGCRSLSKEGITYAGAGVGALRAHRSAVYGPRR